MSGVILFNGVIDDGTIPESRAIVRIKTETWSDQRGIYTKKNIRYLRRKSLGFNILEEDVNNIESQEVIDRIINLHDVKDGIYEISTCNEKRDYETGYIEDYDYKLIEFK
jgi:hypothetical protein